jgi:hypothetical protein
VFYCGFPRTRGISGIVASLEQALVYHCGFPRTTGISVIVASLEQALVYHCGFPGMGISVIKTQESSYH